MNAKMTSDQAKVKLISGDYATSDSLRTLVSRVDSKASGLVDLFFRDKNKVALKTAGVLSDIVNQSSS